MALDTANERNKDWHPDIKSRIKCARHELKCRECRVTWYSWALRLFGIGGMSPLAKNWRRN